MRLDQILASMQAPGEAPVPAVLSAALRAAAASDSGLEGMGLWVAPSWRAARRMGIRDEEFARWVSLGMWNIEGDMGVRRAVLAYREVAGEHGWILAKAKIDPDRALEQYAQEGREAVLEAARAMVALTGLGEDLPPEERAPRPAPSVPGTPEPGPIDFS